MKREKVQVTLPSDLKLLLEEQSKQELVSMSAFVERAIKYYFEQKNITKLKKVIDLGI
jgi:metal-responsive CopG/Arc/MetJ family transcriptional regulator